MELPFIKHSPESEAAAASNVPTAETKRQAVLDYLIQQGMHGATDDEIQVALDMNPSTERPRRVELYEARQIAKTLRTRLTRGRRQAVVWVAYRVVVLWPCDTYRLWPEQ